MPTLKQLACSIELGGTNTKLTEYGTRYSDGNVETFVAVPREEVPFSVHVESEGYIAPGLAMFVYMDGDYQCNRNRRGLVVPGAGVAPEKYQVDLRVRQKEAKQPDGSFLGRAWTFHGLELVSSDGEADTSRQFLDNVGTIEVVVLRCKEAPVRRLSARRLGVPGQGAAVVDSPARGCSEQQPSRRSTKPHAKALSTKPGEGARSTRPVQAEEAPTVSDYGIGGIMGGLDGAADDYVRPPYSGRGHFVHSDERAYDSPPVRRSGAVPGRSPSSVGAAYSEDGYDTRRGNRHPDRQYIMPHDRAHPAQYRPGPSAPHPPQPLPVRFPGSGVGQRGYYEAYRPRFPSPGRIEPQHALAFGDPYSNPSRASRRQQQPLGYRGYPHAYPVPVVNSNTEDDQSTIDRAADCPSASSVPRSYLPGSNEAVRDESVLSSRADYLWEHPAMERHPQEPTPTTVSSNWRTKLWAESLPEPGGSVSKQRSDSRPWPTLESTSRKGTPQLSVRGSSRGKASNGKAPSGEESGLKAQGTDWDKASVANWDEAPSMDWNAVPVEDPGAIPEADWNANSAAAGAAAEPLPEGRKKDGPQPGARGGENKPTSEDEPKSQSKPEAGDWKDPEPRSVASGEKQPGDADWKELDAAPLHDNNEAQTSGWVESTQETAEANQQMENQESQEWNEAPAEETAAPTGDWNNHPAEPATAQADEWTPQPETNAPEEEVRPPQAEAPREKPRPKPQPAFPKPETTPQGRASKDRKPRSHAKPPPSTLAQGAGSGGGRGRRPNNPTDGAHSPPKPKRYWQDWNKKPSDQAQDVSGSRFRYLAPEEAQPRVPAAAAERRSVEHQVKTGKGAQYVHLCSRPEYLDDMRKPYAVFTFKYRSRKVVEGMFGVEVEDDGRDLRAKLADMSKDELAEELFGLRMAGKSSVTKPSTVVSRVDAWMQKAAGGTGTGTGTGKAPSVSRSARSKHGSQTGSRVPGASQVGGSDELGDWKDPNGGVGGGHVQATEDWDAGQPAAGNGGTDAAW